MYVSFFSALGSVSVPSHDNDSAVSPAGYFLTSVTQLLARGISDGLGLWIKSKQDMVVTYFTMSSLDTEADGLDYDNSQFFVRVTLNKILSHNGTQ
jgi:hypothetical protein